MCGWAGPAKEKLAIFGTLWARCGAELKACSVYLAEDVTSRIVLGCHMSSHVQVMAAIETKLPGFYTTNLGETQSWDEPLPQGNATAFGATRLGSACQVGHGHLPHAQRPAVLRAGPQGLHASKAGESQRWLRCNCFVEKHSSRRTCHLDSIWCCHEP